VAQKTFPEFSVVEAGRGAASEPEPGLTRRLGAYNDKLFLAEHHMQAGWAGAKHSHVHDQVVYVVKGHLRVCVAQTTFEVGQGDSFVVRGGVEHQAWAVADSVVVDVFTPMREDYL